MTDDEIDARLASVSLRTSSIGANQGFSEAVMRRVSRERPHAFPTFTARAVRRTVLAAALVAAVALLASLVSQRALDSALASGADALGAEW